MHLLFHLEYLHIEHRTNLQAILHIASSELPSFPPLLFASLLQPTTTTFSIDLGGWSGWGWGFIGPPYVICGLVPSDLEANSHSVSNLLFRNISYFRFPLEGRPEYQRVALIWTAFKNVKHLTCNLLDLVFLKNFGSPNLASLTIDPVVGFCESDDQSEFTETARLQEISNMEELLALLRDRKHPLENLK